MADTPEPIGQDGIKGLRLEDKLTAGFFVGTGCDPVYVQVEIVGLERRADNRYMATCLLLENLGSDANPIRRMGTRTPSSGENLYPAKHETHVNVGPLMVADQHH